VSPQEDLAVENLRRLIERMQEAVALIQEGQKGYAYVMAWRSPLLTGTLMGIFVYLCLFMDAEKAGALLVFLLLLVMTYAYFYRSTGRFRRCATPSSHPHLPTGRPVRVSGSTASL
jgi:hypothetical protein